MRVDVSFVNFPVSESIRERVSKKIEEHVSKFSNHVAHARAVFALEGSNYILRLHVTAGEINTFVSATGTEMGKCVEQVIDKLDASLRKVHEKSKNRRYNSRSPEAEGTSSGDNVEESSNEIDVTTNRKTIRKVG